jgi:hypothetical protein
MLQDFARGSFATLILCALAVGCRTAAPVNSFSPESQPLIKLAHEVDDAILRSDTVALDRFLAPEYVYSWTEPSSRTPGVMKPIAPRAKQYDLLFKDLAGAKVLSNIIDARVYGPYGLVSSAYRWVGSYRGQPFDHQGRMVDVWIHRGHRWQLLSSSAQLFPECGAPF